MPNFLSASPGFLLIYFQCSWSLNCYLCSVLILQGPQVPQGCPCPGVGRPWAAAPQGCPCSCSSVGHLWATVPSEVCLLWDRAPPSMTGSPTLSPSTCLLHSLLPCQLPRLLLCMFLVSPTPSGCHSFLNIFEHKCHVLL